MTISKPPSEEGMRSPYAKPPTVAPMCGTQQQSCSEAAEKKHVDSSNAVWEQRIQFLEASIAELKARTALPPSQADDLLGSDEPCYTRPPADWQAVARMARNLSAKCSHLETGNARLAEELLAQRVRYDALAALVAKLERQWEVWMTTPARVSEPVRDGGTVSPFPIHNHTPNGCFHQDCPACGGAYASLFAPQAVLAQVLPEQAAPSGYVYGWNDPRKATPDARKVFGDPMQP